jgi:hypothetical protein
MEQPSRGLSSPGFAESVWWDAASGLCMPSTPLYASSRPVCLQTIRVGLQAVFSSRVGTTAHVLPRLPKVLRCSIIRPWDAEYIRSHCFSPPGLRAPLRLTALLWQISPRSFTFWPIPGHHKAFDIINDGTVVSEFSKISLHWAG